MQIVPLKSLWFKIVSSSKCLSAKGLLLSVVFSFGVSVAHACTLPKSYYKNVSCTSASGVFLAVKDNGSPVALLDKSGKQTANLFAYDAVLPRLFAGGLLPVRKGNKIGYINSRGKVVIALKYDSLGGGAWARPVANGRIVVKQGGRLGVIDTTGKVIVAFSPDYRGISDFRNNQATITTKSDTYQIDRQGKRLANHENSPNDNLSNEQKMNAKSSQINTPVTVIFYPSVQDDKWGFVDGEGTLMITHSFKEVRPYSEGLAAVKVDTLWGFIDLAGNLVIEFRFDDAGIDLESTHAPSLNQPLMFINNKAWIGNLNDGTKLCINPKGENIACD